MLLTTAILGSKSLISRVQGKNKVRGTEQMTRAVHSTQHSPGPREPDLTRGSNKELSAKLFTRETAVFRTSNPHPNPHHSAKSRIE